MCASVSISPPPPKIIIQLVLPCSFLSLWVHINCYLHTQVYKNNIPPKIYYHQYEHSHPRNPGHQCRRPVVGRCTRLCCKSFINRTYFPLFPYLISLFLFSSPPTQFPHAHSPTLPPLTPQYIPMSKTKQTTPLPSMTVSPPPSAPQARPRPGPPQPPSASPTTSPPSPRA